MIRITAKINIGVENGDSGTISNITADINGNNISAPISAVIGKHTQKTVKTFTLGKTKLGTGAKYCSALNYYKGSVLSNSNGVFETPYVITVSGSNIAQLAIEFDTNNKHYPKSITVDGNVYYDDDSIYTVPTDESTTEHTITIANWNTPNEPLIISSIYCDISIDINETNLLDFNRTIIDRSDTKKPSYGIISNSGSISLIDKNGEILEYIQAQLINGANTVSVYIENTKTSVKEQIGYFNTADWSYKNSMSIVDISLKDDLEEWQDINVPAINYTPTVSTSQTAQWFYNYLYSKTPAKYQMLSFDELDSATQDILSGTTIKYPLLESASLWAEWDKLCQLCFSRIYKRNDGRTIFKYDSN